MIDLRQVQSQTARRGYVLQCPECGQWARSLLIVASGELICRKCASKNLGGIIDDRTMAAFYRHDPDLVEK